MAGKRILIFGKSGQVAQSLKAQFPEAINIGRERADFLNPASVLAVLNELRPELVINAAAYTEVDKAEIEPGRSQLINCDTPGDIAFWCKDNSASLLHFSTDYVYSGTGNDPWRETDPVAPQNRYGISKLAGEGAIFESGCHALILRTSWVYSFAGRNFVRTMLQLGSERETLSVVDDQVGAPTFAPDLAEAVFNLSRHPDFLKFAGIYNVSNSGWTSWHAFADEIFKRASGLGIGLKIKELKKLSSAEFPTPAKRPLNSRMNTLKIKEDFGIELRPWQSALNDCLEKIAKEINADGR